MEIASSISSVLTLSGSDTLEAEQFLKTLRSYFAILKSQEHTMGNTVSLPAGWFALSMCGAFAVGGVLGHIGTIHVCWGKLKAGYIR